MTIPRCFSGKGLILEMDGNRKLLKPQDLERCVSHISL